MGANDLALVRLAYRVPSSLALPLGYSPWQDSVDTADYGTFGFGNAIFLRSDTLIEIYEQGWYQGTFGQYQAGDVFRVEVSGGQVRYRRNGQVFHSSGMAPTYPLVLDTSLYDGGATITGAIVE